MPFNAEGKWIPEDQSVAKQMNGLLASDSKYIKQARHSGVRTAASRGLQNSSMAAGASEASAIAAAAPIASQDAGQIAAQNLAGQQGDINKSLQDDQQSHSLELQGNDLESRRGLLGLELDSRESLQSNDLNSRSDLLGRELDSRESLQANDINSRTNLQTMSDNAATLRQKLQIEGSLTAQERSDLAAMDRQMASLSSQERQALLSSDTQLRGQQIAANSNLTSNYLNAIGNLSSNPEISATDRNAYVAEFQRVTNQGRAYSDNITSAPLSWGNSGNSNGAAAALPSPAAIAPPASSPAPIANNGNSINGAPINTSLPGGFGLQSGLMTSNGGSQQFGDSGIFGGAYKLSPEELGLVFQNGQWQSK